MSLLRIQTEEILNQLQALGTPENRAGMARFGIAVELAYGVTMPNIRQLAKEFKKNHALALELWQTSVHEARILAALVDNPKEVTRRQMEAWVLEFNSWDVCDQCCGNLFDKTPWAYEKAIEWSEREETFVKRAGFTLMATLAVHDKKADHESFRPFFSLIEREAWDNRNFVKKAVNWALRQIGKRNRTLHTEALTVAHRIQQQTFPSARWIARDALRELMDEKIMSRLK
jgi:3-methyladenine DNA glycosylase AlkD